MMSPWELLSTALVAMVVMVATSWVISRRRQHSLFSGLGYPGPPPELVWGSWKQLQKDRIPVMGEWIRKYGKIFGFYLAEKPYMVITDVDVIKEIFIKDSRIFQDRPLYALDVEPMTSSVFFVTGSEWRKVRSIMNQGFTATKVKLYSGIVNKCADVFVDLLGELCSKSKVAEMYGLAQSLALDIITKAALAWEIDCQRESKDPFLTWMRKVFEQADKTALESSFAFPALRPLFLLFYPLSSFARCMKKMMDDVDKITEERRTGKRPRSEDMIQMILDAQENANCNHAAGQKVKTLEDRHVSSNAVVLLIAGFDTTASALSFLMHLVAKHPEEQKKILDELEERFPGVQELSFEQLHELERLDMVVKEALRLYPPVPLMVARRCIQNTTVLGHFIPAGVNIIAPAWYVHRDPELWREPEKFMPDRFSEEESKKRHGAAYFPFGLGQRTCLGKRVGLMTMKTALIKTLRDYKLEICEKSQDPLLMTVPSLVGNPMGGVHLKLTGRHA
ncbi:cytochrome P450 3A6-like [Dermacentor andersoni]|uniref:cytochrome P450 3A6-like n=1 Tax=Dermacentor andersoni TaxID=34620 RepID=UPI003B3A3749